MKTHVRGTSLATHRTNLSDGTYNRTTEIIMRYIAAHPGCLRTDIERDTRLRINQISGRCAELLRHGRIGEGETVETAPGHYAARLYTVQHDAEYSRTADGQLFFA